MTAPATQSIAQLFTMAFQGLDLRPLRRSLEARCAADPLDAGALLDCSVVEQLLGNPAAGLACQARALEITRLYRSSWPASRHALRVLALVADGDVSTNTPIDFLLDGSDVLLYSLYLAPGSAISYPLPKHDVALVTVSESDRTHPTLRRIEEELMPRWPCPVLNRPSRIRMHSREKMYQVLQGAPGVFMPPTVRVSRSVLHDLAGAPDRAATLLGDGGCPMIARPIGSHAGHGLEKLASGEAIDRYLAQRPEREFFLSPFVDYRSSDQFFRKYRIVWVEGRPYPVHMAIASEWKVWYLNADMAASAWKRREEEHFLSDFDNGFGQRHAAALGSIAERFGLAYFGIDCGELPDGRLLVFEGSVALVAHDMDPPDVYPYKGAAMQRLFRAFYEMLQRNSLAQHV